MTDVTISREEIRDIFYRMDWKPEDAETFIRSPMAKTMSIRLGTTAKCPLWVISGHFATCP